ncbi:MAG: DoxX family membrane protein [Candidatus Omnitrophica bacterium]|nr:DoxX family membrane protein [Candidatus Omnitrophota bacterium]
MNKLYFVFRLMIGLIFFISGGEKVLGPHQNFLYVIQGYEFFPLFLAKWIAIGLPWVEFFAGIFLLLGLWTRYMLYVSAGLFFGFVTVVSQAMVRGLDLSDCGCFGELISLPLWFVFSMDVTLLLICVWLIRNIQNNTFLSLDNKFD